MKTTSSDLVTIAIPAYKATFLSDAIKSALNQTYKNIEVLIIDDCSPEPVERIVKNFQDPRIRYHKNETNLGQEDPGKNWNECLKFANGKYFALLCDDDFYAPSFIENMLYLREQYPNVKVFRSRVNVIDRQGKIIDLYPASPSFETYDDYMWQKFSGLRRQTISEFLFETQYIKNLGGYVNLPMAWGSDVLSIIKFAYENGIASTNDILVQFRLSNENISSNSNHKIKQKFNALNKFHTLIKQITQSMPKSIQRTLIEKKSFDVYRKDFAYLFSIAKIKDYPWIFVNQKISFTIMAKCFEEKMLSILAKSKLFS